MWAQDYCTVCDKQCSPGAVYCSETCKLSELNRSTESLDNVSMVSLSMYSNGKFHNLSSPVVGKVSPSATTTPTSTNTSTPTHTSTDKKFLYDSPMLKPQSKSLPSPPLSPLMMPSNISNVSDGFYTFSPCGASTSPTSPNAKFESTHQTSATYRRWLTAVV